MSTDSMLAGVNVAILGGEAAARSGRVLADLGAHVTRVSPADAPDGLSDRLSAWQAWTMGVTIDRDRHNGCDAAAVAAAAHIVIDTPHDPTTIVLDPTVAPAAHWVHITPFGLSGPRSNWVATDLGVMAASGNLFATGDPDRPPVRAASAPAAQRPMRTTSRRPPLPTISIPQGPRAPTEPATAPARSVPRVRLLPHRAPQRLPSPRNP